MKMKEDIETGPVHEEANVKWWPVLLIIDDTTDWLPTINIDDTTCNETQLKPLKMIVDERGQWQLKNN